MVTTSRAERVSAAFVRITDTLVGDYDVLDLLHALVESSVDLLDAAAAGLLLADPHGQLQVVASTSERSQLVEILQLQAGSGPCVESYQTGTPVALEDIRSLNGRWPEFQAAALSQGFRSVHAVPMRVHGKTIGAMGLFGEHPGALSQEDAAIGQALADVATISILQERTLRESALVNEQLQRALNSRVLIEQAKGVIAYTAGVDMEEAFRRLRTFARANNQTLHDTASQVIGRTLNL
ncbi:GAF and ANTAR domain-containing protein [Arthrobacter sp. KBS0703]|uniref:GAF and ANTAR domain-containing protein n=1 Tax=Arthrobacter sp. KBS0703 TaxID=1955698 RepID=UPI00098FBD25|nr:GAF and ANTAR domain-containing protein [Arthrobacter sp. KBS0703]TSE17329.1 GAF and ANTAR domain-containing protein [Arthrobacter sp. KBS0703]